MSDRPKEPLMSDVASALAHVCGDDVPPRLDRASQVALWEAVRRYVRACGGDPARGVGSTEKCNAVIDVERAALALRRGEEPTHE